MDDHDGTADLRIHVNEGGVFTVQGFDIIGLNPELRTRLIQAWPFKAGDIYRGENVENFLDSKAALLPDVSPNDVVCRTVDLSNHTIDFVLDFRPQPLACNGRGKLNLPARASTAYKAIANSLLNRNHLLPRLILSRYLHDS